MAQFTAFDFLYDEVPSATFDLKIIDLDNSGIFSGVGSSNIEILEQRVLRKSKPFFLGRVQPTKLEFPLTFGTARPISAMDRDMISAWLFGRAGYKKLYILQDDLNGAYFNCMLKDPEPQYVGNLNYAFSCTIVCDSPFAYSPEKIYSKVIEGASGEYSHTFNIYNNSSEDEYLYPILDFTFNQVGYGYEYLELYNITDNLRLSSFGKESMFDGTFKVGDNVIVNNDLQMINGTNGYGGPIVGLLTTFNKNWFRLLPGLNSIGVDLNKEHSLIDFKVKWIERLKIGG